VSRLLGPTFRHYEISACIGPTLRATRSIRPIVDTGAGLNLIRPDVLPPNWQTFAEPLAYSPNIMDANGNKVNTQYAIHLHVEAGGLRAFERFLVAQHLSVNCILGTEFITRNVEAILVQKRKIVWKDDKICPSDKDTRPTLILATLYKDEWQRHWKDQPAKVRACKQVRVKGRSEGWVMATCETPGLVLLSPNIRLCRHKILNVARGVATVKPDEPFLVKVCNFGADQAIVRKNSTLAFAEPYQGPMLVAVDDEKQQPTKGEGQDDKQESDDNEEVDDPVEEWDLDEAPEDLRAQIREMLKKHSSMWNGTLGRIHATEHAVVTPPDTLPIRAQPYRTGAFKRQIIVDQINMMLKMNVIQASFSAWASTVVIVPKKNGKARFCADYRRLKNVTKKDAYPLPRMEDFLDSLGDAKVFKSLYCTAGYWQVPLRKQDREKPAFTTHCGI